MTEERDIDNEIEERMADIERLKAAKIKDKKAKVKAQRAIAKAQAKAEIEEEFKEAQNNAAGKALAEAKAATTPQRYPDDYKPRLSYVKIGDDEYFVGNPVTWLGTKTAVDDHPGGGVVDKMWLANGLVHVRIRAQEGRFNGQAVVITRGEAGCTTVWEYPAPKKQAEDAEFVNGEVFYNNVKSQKSPDPAGDPRAAEWAAKFQDVLGEEEKHVLYEGTVMTDDMVTMFKKALRNPEIPEDRKKRVHNCLKKSEGNAALGQKRAPADNIDDDGDGDGWDPADDNVEEVSVRMGG